MLAILLERAKGPLQSAKRAAPKIRPNREKACSRDQSNPLPGHNRQMQLRLGLCNIHRFYSQAFSNKTRKESAKIVLDAEFSFGASKTTLSTGLAVATTGIVGPAVSLVWKIPAGSRYENAESSGHSHFLRHALFAVLLTGIIEILQGGTSLQISNNHDSITISCDLPHEEAYWPCPSFDTDHCSPNIVESISGMLQDFHIEEHHMDAIKQRVALDRTLLVADVRALLWEKGFEAAYRTGLGNPVVSAALGPVSASSIKAFLLDAVKRGGHIVSSTGLDQLELVEMIKSKYDQSLGQSNPVSGPSKYYGGERRIESKGDHNHVLIAFGTNGYSDSNETFAAQILAAMFDSHQAVQYGSRLSHVPSLRKLQEKHPHVLFQSKVNQAIDGGLFGIFISAPTGVDVKPAIETICHEIRAIVTGTSDFISSDVVQAAKQRAAFQLSNIVDSRIEHAEALATYVLAQNAPLNLHEEISKLHAPSTNEFRTCAAKIVSRKPVFLGLGDLRSLPYADEISP